MTKAQDNVQESVTQRAGENRTCVSIMICQWMMIVNISFSNGSVNKCRRSPWTGQQYRVRSKKTWAYFIGAEKEVTHVDRTSSMKASERRWKETEKNNSTTSTLGFDSNLEEPRELKKLTEERRLTY